MRLPAIPVLCFLLLPGGLAAQFQPRGPEVHVAAAEAGQAVGAPSIARGAHGGFVVVWTRIIAGHGEVRMRRFDGAGHALSSGLPVASSSSSAGSQGDPAVALDPEGKIAVAWTEGSRLLGRLFDAKGEPGGAAFEIDAGESRAPDLAAIGPGSFLAAWAGRNPTLGWDVRARHIGADGVLATVSTLSNFPVESTRPAVSCDGGEGCAVVWDGYNAAGVNGIFLRRLDSSGVPQGDLPATIKTVLALAGSAVAGDSRGGFLVAWVGDTAIYARRLDALGQPAGEEIRIADPGVLPGRLDAAADGAGNILLTWGDCCGAGRAPLSGVLLDGADHITAGPVAIRPDLGGGLPAVAGGGDGDFRLAWVRGDSAPREVLVEDLGPVSPCVADATTLCLNGSRFEVRAHWRKADGSTGTGQVRPLTADTGSFWFFGEENVAVVVKVLAACALPGRHFWVYAAGLTNLGVTLDVTDTRTGAVRTYENPLGKAFVPIEETSAFECGG
jgi:hypothetical protein